MLAGAVVAVVVPARNEEPWLAEVLDTMPSFVDRIVVVDDASSDDTGAIARERARRASQQGGPAVDLLRHRRRRGVGAAIATGYGHALRAGAEVVAVMAGDGQMDPADLESLVRPVAEGAADYVKGNRLAHPSASAAMPPLRRHGTRVLSWLTTAAAGVPVMDTQCGYTAVAAGALARIDLAGLWPGFGYPNDLIGALARVGARIDEAVVRPVYRGEDSALRPWHGLTIGAVLLRTAWRRWFGHPPSTR